MAIKIEIVGANILVYDDNTPVADQPEVFKASTSRLLFSGNGQYVIRDEGLNGAVKDFRSKQFLYSDLRDNAGQSFATADLAVRYLATFVGVRSWIPSTSGGVQSVDGDFVDNTDPNNPVIIPNPILQLSATSVGVTNINTNATNRVIWDVADDTAPTYFDHTLGSATVEVLRDMIVEIDFNLSGVHNGAGNNRANVLTAVSVNGVFEPRTASYVYIRNGANPRGTCSLGIVELEFSAGDLVELFTQRVGDSGTVLFEGPESWMKIKVIELL